MSHAWGQVAQKHRMTRKFQKVKIFWNLNDFQVLTFFVSPTNFSPFPAFFICWVDSFDSNCNWLTLTFLLTCVENVKTLSLFYLDDPSLKIFSRNFVFWASVKVNRDSRLVGTRTSNLKINSAGIQVRTFLFAWLILITELVVTGFEPKTSGVEAAKFTTL